MRIKKWWIHHIFGLIILGAIFGIFKAQMIIFVFMLIWFEIYMAWTFLVGVAPDPGGRFEETRW